MAYRKKSLRSMSPTTRKVARLIGELESVTRRAKNIIPELQRLELDSQALYKRKEYEDKAKDCPAGKHCPQCNGKLKVIDVSLGFGNPVLYLCENGHKVEGHERIYTDIVKGKWEHIPLRVVQKWSRWDEELTAEYCK